MTGAWETVIGLEVHAQLLTATKAFCGCAAAVGGAPNSRCCPVCLGLPGALPVLNRQAVELTLRVGLATGCRIAPVSVMARKHYFYPDLPKGYQISQYARPLCEEGALTVDGRRVRLKRIHLEEDAGKSVHGAGGTRVDLNRCGVPLAEIVTEPDLRSPAEAHATLRALRQLLVYLGVCDGNMEEGSLRCDANLSLRRPGSTALGVKTELKNLNSFRGVEAALRFEAERQAALLEAGERVRPETLLWDAAAREARPMRGKEDAEDYRYVPDPDLPPVRVDPAWLDAVRASLPELPAARAAQHQDRRWRWHRDVGRRRRRDVDGQRGLLGGRRRRDCDCPAVGVRHAAARAGARVRAASPFPAAVAVPAADRRQTPAPGRARDRRRGPA